MALMGLTDVRLGCQGWTAPDWQGPFYPWGLPTGERLGYYSRVFDFVEIDTSFYAIPAPGIVERWRDSTPDSFRFAAKLPQSITHDPDPVTGLPRHPLQSEGLQNELQRFLESITRLEEKLISLVVQLPPQWHWHVSLLPVLDKFLASLPTGLPWAVEVRHRGWLRQEVFDLLQQRGVALVSQDLYYMPKLVQVTTPELFYVRLQGRRKDLTKMNALQIERDEALDFWADVIRRMVEMGVKTVVVAANNHYQGYAPGTLAALRSRLGLPAPEGLEQGRLAPLGEAPADEKEPGRAGSREAAVRPE